MVEEDSVNEKLLYHGTSHSVTDNICFENHILPLPGENSTTYGKGAYFSASASVCHNYSTPDSKGHFYMFIAQVLVGRYTAVSCISWYHILYFLKHFLVY